MVEVVRKAFLNKKNKQMSVSIPKKELKKLDPTIKFGDELFVRLSIFKKNGNKNK